MHLATRQHIPFILPCWTTMIIRCGLFSPQETFSKYREWKSKTNDASLALLLWCPFSIDWVEWYIYKALSSKCKNIFHALSVSTCAVFSHLFHRHTQDVLIFSTFWPCSSAIWSSYWSPGSRWQRPYDTSHTNDIIIQQTTSERHTCT